MTKRIMGEDILHEVDRFLALSLQRQSAQDPTFSGVEFLHGLLLRIKIQEQFRLFYVLVGYRFSSWFAHFMY